MKDTLVVYPGKVMPMRSDLNRNNFVRVDNSVHLPSEWGARRPLYMWPGEGHRMLRHQIPVWVAGRRTEWGCALVSQSNLHRPTDADWDAHVLLCAVEDAQRRARRNKRKRSRWA